MNIGHNRNVLRVIISRVALFNVQLTTFSAVILAFCGYRFSTKHRKIHSNQRTAFQAAKIHSMKTFSERKSIRNSESAYIQWFASLLTNTTITRDDAMSPFLFESLLRHAMLTKVISYTDFFFFFIFNG